MKYNNDMELSFPIDETWWTIEVSQGIVVRRNKSLFADWNINKKDFEWMTPTISETKENLDKIAKMCCLFVDLYKKADLENY